MPSKLLIIVAVIGITTLAIFNLISSHHTQQVIAANQAMLQSTSPASATVATTPLGEQPKAMLDKANAGINQANADTANKMADTEKTTQ